MFQKSIAQGRFTLAVVALIALVAWAVLPPDLSWRLLLGFLSCAVCVYLLTELNNAFVLLRINSRMIGSTLAILLAPAVMLHELQTAHLILLCSVVAYYPLFASYQRPHATVLSYLAFLAIGISSTVFPQLLHFVPVCWIAQIMLRTMSTRIWVASLLGIVTPYCFLFTYGYCTDQMAVLTDRFVGLMRFDQPDYTSWTLMHFVVASLALLHFLIGSIDFLRNIHLDKTRTRCNYYVVLLVGSLSFAWLLLQPQHALFILPLCLTNTAIMSGHFSAQSYGKVQNIVVVILTVLSLGACLLPILPFHL
ncbi:MAG: hypothetical protein Q4E32_00160 [Bacteroidales bacterium]|nr:hypothetical protein [Bacteroidales bacterium]